MQTAKDLPEYRHEVKQSLDKDFQRKALDTFAKAYRQSRANAFSGMDLQGLIDEISQAKDEALPHLEAMFKAFKARAEAKGVTVHLAKSAREANRIISSIAREHDCQKIVKSKSMTAEETLLNHHLEDLGLEVTETDLGEWIIQLRHEGPSHMVMPAIHLSKEQVGDLFTEVTGQLQDNEIEKLVKVARRELRQRYVDADMGISGANFAIAESGTLGIVTNEGNARLVTTLPRVHVTLTGIDKLVPTLHDALRVLKGLPKNATGQNITSYVTWITGANECQSAPGNTKNMHVVFLDNGRLSMSRDPVFSEALKCVRCGACANVCPIYRLIGGHTYGHIYIGAIGLILTYFFHGHEKDMNLVQNCLNCQACKDVCVAGIDLPRLIKETQALIQSEQRRPALNMALSVLLTNRRLFHAMLRSAKWAQKPVTGRSQYLRHLPHFFLKDHDFKSLPAIARKPFRDRWSKNRPRVEKPLFTVALFAGCLQDFVYPEQLEQAMALLRGQRIQVDFPMQQGCCGLPAQMVGEKKAAREVATHNISVFDPSKYDAILTLCASCGSHLKENYPHLLAGQSGLQVKVQQFSDRIMDFSSFLYRVAKLERSMFKPTGPRFAYHAPCHLCRGLGVKKGPRELLKEAGLDYIPHEEEETCCGLGGTYAVKFPELSSTMVTAKLDLVTRMGAQMLVTDCPGCIMQLRGTAEKQKRPLEVLHTVEALTKQLHFKS